MYQLNKVFVLFISTAMLLFSNFAMSESTTKHTKPIENNEHDSLSAPTSKSPHDEKQRTEANDRNLSSPPPRDSSTNNKPFDKNEKNRSSENHPKTH